MVQSTNVSRRTVVKGAAWTAPAVAVASAVPAFGQVQSCPITEAEAEAVVKKYIEAYADALPNLSSQKFRVWFQGAAMVNGALGEQGLRIQNISDQSVSLSQYPLLLEFGIKNITTSPAVNETLTSIEGTANIDPIPEEWPGQGDAYATTNDANKPWANLCGPDTRRDVSIGSSYATFYSPDRSQYIGTELTEMGEERMFCVANDTAYGGFTAFNEEMQPNDEIRAIAYHMRDATTGNSAAFSALGFSLVGFLPPTYELFKDSPKNPGVEPEAFDICFREAFLEYLGQWLTLTEPKLPTIYARGWSKSWIDNRVDDGVSRNTYNRGVDREISAGQWVWSNESGNFLLRDPLLEDGGKGVEFTGWNTLTAKGSEEDYAMNGGTVKAFALDTANRAIYERDGIY